MEPHFPSYGFVHWIPYESRAGSISGSVGSSSESSVSGSGSTSDDSSGSGYGSGSESSSFSAIGQSFSPAPNLSQMHLL